MVVDEPLKVTIINYPENKIESSDVPYHKDLDLGIRKVFFLNIFILKNQIFKLKN